MPPLITFPITSQRQFDKAVDKYNAANPPPAPVVVDPVLMISASNTNLNDNTKRIFLFEGGGVQNVVLGAQFNALPNGTELQFIRMSGGTMSLSGANGVSIAGVGSNGDAVGPVERMTLIKFGPAAWLLYSFIPYTAP